MVQCNETKRNPTAPPASGRFKRLFLTLILAAVAGGLALSAGCGGPPKPKTVAKKAKAKAKPKPIKIPPAEPDKVPEACADHDKKLAEEFTPYVDAFHNVGHELSPDGKTLLFRSNRGGGSFQLYLGDVKKAGAEPKAVDEAKDGVGSTRYTPDGKYILYTRDKDRNENTQIFRANADGSDVKALTEAPDMYHHLPQVTADGATLYYFQGTQKSGDTVLVSQPVDGGAAKEVFKAKGFHFLTDLTKDGGQGLVCHLKSLSESVLLLVDTKEGKAKQIAPPEGKKAHACMAAFSADEKSVFVVTDLDAEVAGMHRIDLDSLEVKANFNDYLAETADVRVSPKGDLVAVMLDAGSHHTVKLLDSDKLEEKKAITLPMGSVQLGRFTKDGSALVLTFSGPADPTDAFLADAKRGRIKPLRQDKRPGLNKLVKLKESEEKVATFDQFKVPVNLYLPQLLPRGKTLPVIVSVHGGPAAASSFGWDPMVSFWISKGFVVVEPNVRGSTGFGKKYEQADNGQKRMDALKDLEAVNTWIRAQPWADAERIVVYGGSYGGYMVYMALGHQSDKWNAGIGLVGVVNLRTFLKTTTGAIQLVFKDEFGELPKDGKFLDSISPIQVAGKIKAPLFVYQGANDPRVPRSEQDQLVNALRKARVLVEYMVAPDEGHSLSQRNNKLEFASRTTRFLEANLDLEGPSDECKTVTPAAGEKKAGDKPAPAKGEAKKAEDKPAPAKKK